MADWSIPKDFPLGELVTQELTYVSIGRSYVRLMFIRLKALFLMRQGIETRQLLKLSQVFGLKQSIE